ncbi:conserved hypothetical protein [Frankia canadensis]|uniref:Uncharacterized protein n=1 Tax=Frankia canadensis TaxID=1836972 RepID=A0A2I2KT04_9ACTN|nr:histidine kinase [Frankia canadensis]SNQ48769.1 conserved hypothetical protein [Frankia canadensis]SOU56059.1 conserved hypothetical protein [Frankia canadensis]
MTAPSGDEPPSADTAVARVHELLRLVIDLQERAQRAAADRLHDGPMQEFTAILLELASVRRRLPAGPAERVLAVENRLRLTTVGLQAPSVFRLAHDARAALIAGLTQRVDGLLVDRLDTELRVEAHPPTLTEVAVVLGAVQLLLTAGSPHRRGEHAWLSAESGPDGLALRLRVRPPGPRPGSAADQDPAPAALLRPLADLIGATVTDDPATTTWSAALHVPRPPRPAAGR